MKQVRLGERDQAFQPLFDRLFRQRFSDTRTGYSRWSAAGNVDPFAFGSTSRFYLQQNQRVTAVDVLQLNGTTTGRFDELLDA